MTESGLWKGSAEEEWRNKVGDEARSPNRSPIGIIGTGRDIATSMIQSTHLSSISTLCCRMLGVMGQYSVNRHLILTSPFYILPWYWTPVIAHYVHSYSLCDIENLAPICSKHKVLKVKRNRSKGRC
jgi:hypothetical protein